MANLTLNELEKAIRESVGPKRKVNCVRYADDFIVTGDSRDVMIAMPVRRNLQYQAIKPHMSILS